VAISGHLPALLCRLIRKSATEWKALAAFAILFESLPVFAVFNKKMA
jgi:hypothetical protein